MLDDILVVGMRERIIRVPRSDRGNTHRMKAKFSNKVLVKCVRRLIDGFIFASILIEMQVTSRELSLAFGRLIHIISEADLMLLEPKPGFDNISVVRLIALWALFDLLRDMDTIFVVLILLFTARQRRSCSWYWSFGSIEFGFFFLRLS